MTTAPVICFGQQPCGIFPRRFLFAKIATARGIRSEIGGRIVFFYHDSDHDPRETKTILRHRKLGEPFEINFTYENKLQRKYSPLFLKRVSPEWRDKTALQLPAYVERRWADELRQIALTNTADFCLEMYRRMGLLEGIEVVRSSDPAFRLAACDISDFYIDVPWHGEIVRARRMKDGTFCLHEGGDSFITLPPAHFGKSQVSPTRDTRLAWMQSVVCCTHYVSGASEQQYMRKEDAPEITYIERETIDRSDEAYIPQPA